MRKYLAIATVMALLVSMTAFPATAQEGKTGKIRFAIYTDKARDNVAAAQAALYMEMNPGVTVEVVSIPYANYYVQPGQGIASGDAWDVFMINGASFANLSSTGALYDLTDEIMSRGINLSEYVTDPLNSTYDGRQYVLTYEVDTSAILFNKDLFDAAGVPYPQEDWTWEDFENTAKALTKPDENQFGCYMRLAHPDLTSLIKSAGGSLYSEDMRTIDFSTEEVVKALSFMTNLVRNGYAPTPGQIASNVTPFLTGKIAMASALCFDIISTIGVSFNWDVAPWPKDVQGGMGYWTQGMAVYNNSKNLDLSLDFLFFLMGEEAQTIMASEHGATPSLLSVAMGEAYLNESWPSGMKYFVTEYINGNAAPEPMTAKWAAISGAGTSVVQSEMTLVRLGTLSLEEAIRNMTEQGQELLDEIY